MEFVFSLFSKLSSLNFPQSWEGRIIAGLGWLFWLALILALLWRSRRLNQPFNKNYWGTWFVLALLTPIASMFIGISLPSQGVLPAPNIPLGASAPVLMMFSALPWMIAGGILGPVGGASIAVISGIFLGLWNTHSPFTPLELALIAALFSLAMLQRYRTRFFRWLRHPLFAAILLVFVDIFIFLLDAIILSDNSLATRLDYGFSLLFPMTLAVMGELIIGGLFTEVIARAMPEHWGGRGELRPSPAERSLRARYLLVLIPLILLLLFALFVGDWVVAGQAAQRSLRGRMQDSALLISGGIPFFLDVGQNEIAKLVEDKSLYANSPAGLSELLKDYVIRVPFFTQYFMLDSEGKTLAGYPLADYDNSQAPPKERMGIQMAIRGVPYQPYTMSPKPGGKAAQVSFIARIEDDEGKLRGVLVARTDLGENPFTSPLIDNLRALTEIGGQGMLLDEDGLILYHPNPDLLMTEYAGKRPEQAEFYNEPAPDGTRQWVYYQPTEGRPWAVVLTVPARTVQQTAVDIASPMLWIIAVVALFAVVVLSLSLNRITTSLRGLAVQAESIAEGRLDTPLSVAGEDEVSQLRRSFEQMRRSLKARLDELNGLLVVVQGVAENLDMGRAVQPVLESGLSSGACAARVVLDSTMVPDLTGDASKPVAYAAGLRCEDFAYLDEQILNLTRQQDRLVLNNVLRPRLLRFQVSDQRPEALMAMALRHDNQFYGAMWIAFDQPHIFSEEEVRYLATLSSQAALAASNARLYLNAEIGRQRLSAILASTPDPVLVTDQRNRLLLANPAAWRVLGLGAEWEERKPIEQVISNRELLALLDGKAEDKGTAEITLPDGKVYFGTISSVIAEGHRVGQVCVLRDITTYKQLDLLKSEFVATVSHDLRSPLTLMRGYASMLEIVGEMNEQQTFYVRKIINGVDNMTRLVNDLLDLGRIEAGIGLKLEKVPVREIVERVTGGLQVQANNRRIHLGVDHSQLSVPFIEADPALLQQALQNLVENALKYTDQGGNVQVRTEIRQNMMVFIVSDNGIGISPLDLPHLFEKFYRGAQTGAKRLRGTGLGLAIVKSIADRHGGRVWVESQLGKGSTFYLAIPLQRSNKAG